MVRLTYLKPVLRLTKLTKKSKTHARMLDGRVMFARYLGFSCRVLIISVRFLPNRALKEPEKSLKRVLIEP